MSATLAADEARCKHTFGSSVDFEHAFGQHRPVPHRTYVHRRVAALTVALVVVVVTSGPLSRAFAANDQLDLVSSRTVVVRPGDTLWSIAADSAPGRDPREVIDEIERLNAGASASLVPGQVLSLPASG